MIIFYIITSFISGVVISYFIYNLFARKNNACHFQEIFDSINDPIALLSPEGKIIKANKAMLDFFRTNYDEIKNKYCHEIIHLTDKHIENCPLKLSHNTKKREEIEMEFHGKKFIVTVDPIFKNNEIVNFVHIIKDVTYIKQIELDIMEEKRKFETLVNNLPGFVYRCANDRNWTMHYISNGCELVTGYSPEEFINNAKISYNDIIAEEYQEYLWNKWQDLLSKKETFEDEYEIITRNGERRWVWERGRGIFDNNDNLLFLEGFITDITDRKKVFNALLESEEKFKSLAMTTTAAIFIYQNNNFAFVNPATEAITGYTAEELYKMNFWDVVHPDHKEIVKERGLRRQTGEKIPNTYDFKIIRKDGNVRWIKFSGAYISQYQGKPAAIATAFDITEMIEAQNKLQELITQLEENEKILKIQNEEYLTINEELVQSNQRIQKLNEELIKAKEKAEESDRLKTNFLNNISHEIRTPLNAILGFTELLRKKIPEDPKLQEYINIIRLSAENLLNIITNIINIATIESGEEKINYSKINLNFILETIVNSLKPLILKKNLKIHLKKLNDLEANMLSDETKINQIFINLLNNAIKFTEKGEIYVELSIRDKNLYIIIKDTGSGIPEYILPYIFERFVQVSDIYKQYHPGGMGLGLSIVKTYVNLLGGNISVKSKVGEGTEFTIVLPYLPINTNIETNKEETRTSYYLPTGKKILIVEDNANNLELLKEYLASYQVEILSANTGNEAIELFKNNKDIDIVILDIKLPDISGYKVCETLFNINYKVPIIGVTAFAYDEQFKKMKLCGMKETLSKPIKQDTLLRILEKYLNQ